MGEQAQFSDVVEEAGPCLTTRLLPDETGGIHQHAEDDRSGDEGWAGKKLML